MAAATPPPLSPLLLLLWRCNKEVLVQEALCCLFFVCVCVSLESRGDGLKDTWLPCIFMQEPPHSSPPPLASSPPPFLQACEDTSGPLSIY